MSESNILKSGSKSGLFSPGPNPPKMDSNLYSSIQECDLSLFLRRCVKLGCLEWSATVNGMFLEADDALFHRWLQQNTCSTYVLSTYLRGNISFTPSVLKLTTSLSLAKLVNWMNVTLLSGLCIKIVTDYSSTSELLTYFRMFACIHVCLVCNCNHLRLSMWLSKETWWWWWWWWSWWRLVVRLYVTVLSDSM